MLALRGLHLVALIAWFGSALVDTIVEIALKRSPPLEKRTVLIELHRTVDLALEGPGAVLAVVTGGLLLRAMGYFEPGASWPDWLRWKVACGLAAALVNVISVGCVVARARALRAGNEKAVGLWTHAIFATGLGLPFAAAAFLWGLAHA